MAVTDKSSYHNFLRTYSFGLLLELEKVSHTIAVVDCSFCWSVSRTLFTAADCLQLPAARCQFCCLQRFAGRKRFELAINNNTEQSDLSS